MSLRKKKECICEINYVRKLIVGSDINKNLCSNPWSNITEKCCSSSKLIYKPSAKWIMLAKTRASWNIKIDKICTKRCSLKGSRHKLIKQRWNWPQNVKHSEREKTWNRVRDQNHRHWKHTKHYKKMYIKYIRANKKSPLRFTSMADSPHTA